MLIDPLAAFALTLSVSVAGVAYVLRMARIETQRKAGEASRRVR